MSYAVQSITGNEKNKLYEKDHAIHDWYRFVLSYPPHLVRQYLEKFGINDNQCVLDPFCGTGTTLVESKKFGVNSIGIEANNVVQLAAKTKVNWNIDAPRLIEHSESIAKIAISRLRGNSKNLRTLTNEQEKLIIKNSISPLPLHKSIILLEVINEMIDNRFYDIERIAFAKQLVYSYSNLHFGPEVGVSRKKKTDVPVIELWLEQIKKMARDILLLEYNGAVHSEVHLADSRKMGSLICQNTIDAIITSPPYPNEKDYTRTTRLESVLLGFMTEKKDLRNIKETLLRSNTRNIYKGDTDEELISYNKRIIDLAASIENRRIDLGKTSGFERLYHKVVKNYFGGMLRHLQGLKPSLKKGAQLAYVVGDQASYFRIPIRTGEILAEIAADINYEVIGIDLFRSRFSTVTKEQLREEVVLLKWNG